MTETTETDCLTVAVYWPKDGGYGIPCRVDDMRHAQALAKEWQEYGFARGGGEIHIIRTQITRTVTKWGEET